MAYCFRIRFRLSKRVRIDSDADRLTLATAADGREMVTMSPAGHNVSFAEAGDLVLELVSK
jgi:hypothetical protein